MLAFVIRRTLQAAPILLGVSLVLFALVHLLPGHQADLLLPPAAPPDRPLYLQYLVWLGHSITGDLGFSVFNASPVAGQVLAALGNTLELAVPASLLGIGLGLALGLVAAFHRNRWPGKIVNGVASVLVSLPPYWCAIMLLLLSAVLHRWLPAGAMGEADLKSGFQLHLVLPVLALACIPMGAVGQQVRIAVLETLRREFPTALAARGLPGWPILRHVCRNAAPSVLVSIGPPLGTLLGGSILVETVFDWPGSGHLMHVAILHRDIPVLLATLLVLAVLFIVLMLLIDIARAAIDPRLRR
jgi:peptide/nickel transport system permease protein